MNPIALPIDDNLSVELAVLCEDVREELHKKNSLMGVFSADISVAELPATIRTAFFFTIGCRRGGEFTLHMRLMVEEKIAADAPIALTYENDSTGNLIVPLGIVRFEQPVFLKVMFSLDRERWITVIEKKVSIMDGSH